jgi:hypothetical protein
MGDFTIRPPVDADIVQIVESIAHFGRPPIAPPLPADNIQPDLSSFDGSDRTQSDELPYPNDHLGALEDETESLPGVEYDAAEIVHPDLVDIPRTIDIIADILQDPRVLRLNCLGDALLNIIPFTDPGNGNSFLSGTLNVLRKFLFHIGVTVTISFKEDIHALTVRKPHPTRLIPHALSCISTL